MKPMLMTDASVIPTGKEWLYETKYDGFRCILHWTENGVQLFSRNEKLLNDMYPEIIRFCESLGEMITPFLPLTLDGELVHLRNDYRSEFTIVQTRGRMRQKNVIEQHAKAFPCKYIVFDLLAYKKRDQTELPLFKRKESLAKLFEKIGLPLKIDYLNSACIQQIEVFLDAEKIWPLIVTNNGEGIIAKRNSSPWDNAKRTVHWVKVKNWRTVNVIVTKYDKANGFFTGAVFKNEELIEVVTFLHGFDEDELQTLSMLFQTKGKKINESAWVLEPSICVKIHCIDFDGKHLREPRFSSFDFEIDLEACQWRLMLRQLYPIPETVQITHPDKPVWPKLSVGKDDYLLYLQSVSPYMLPFLRNRLLTVIRYAHGVPGEKFYQKNAPNYMPDFVRTSRSDEIDYIVCNNIETLLWLGNQLALEFHIPFQTIATEYPTEIVFDLDPPSVDEFTLAVEAALRMKMIFDQFELQSFVKTSGGKGLQLYIPLPLHTFHYEDTRIFTKFVCDFLCDQEPNWFTTERLKKNRGNKLYLDYVQHHEGKTIVAPYSPRGREEATVAAPLEWGEVTQSLSPKSFTVLTMPDRIKTIGNPFRDFQETGDQQPFMEVLEHLKALLAKQ